MGGYAGQQARLDTNQRTKSDRGITIERALLAEMALTKLDPGFRTAPADPRRSGGRLKIPHGV